MEMLRRILENEKMNESSTAKVIYGMINYNTPLDLTRRREHTNSYIPCGEKVLEGSEQMCLAGSNYFKENIKEISEQILKSGKTRRPAFIQPRINDNLGILEGAR
jgi:hypothetical protein